MIEQQGRVVEIRGTAARVRVGPRTGCPACDRGEGCGAGIFGRLLRRRPLAMTLENSIGAEPGDVVRVGLPERLFVRLVLRLYFLPLLSGLAGAALGHYLGIMVATEGFGLDLAALAGGALGVALALWCQRQGNERMVRGAVSLLGQAGQPESGECVRLSPERGRDTGR